MENEMTIQITLKTSQYDAGEATDLGMRASGMLTCNGDYNTDGYGVTLTCKDHELPENLQIICEEFDGTDFDIRYV